MELDRTISSMLEECDGVRFADPARSLELARHVMEFVGGLPDVSRFLRAKSIAVYGSACRAVGDLERADSACHIAARVANDRAGWAMIARRWSYVRTDQNRLDEALDLVIWGRRFSKGRERIFALVDRGSIFFRRHAFEAAETDWQEARRSLNPADGRWYGGVHQSLAMLAARRGDVELVREHVEAARMVTVPGTLAGLKVDWVEARYLMRAGESDAAYQRYTAVRDGLLSLNAVEAALVAVELAASLLERGAWREIRALAGESFRLFKALRFDREAMAAFSLFYQASLAGSLTDELIEEAHRRLVRRRYVSSSDRRS